MTSDPQAETGSGDQPRKRRGSARKARHEKHRDTSPPAAIEPGMSGGVLKPLTQRDLERIHETTLDVLANIGMGECVPEMIELAEARGCRLNASGRLCFPRGFVEEIIDGAAQEMTLHARGDADDLVLAGNRVHYGTGGAAVKVLDLDADEYRPATLPDLYNFARIADACDNVHWFTRCVIATEYEDMRALDLNTAYAIAAGTNKHIATAISLAENVAAVVELFDMIAGGEGKFRERPFCKVHTSPVVSPLRFGADGAEVCIAATRAGFPINGITAPQAGATAPAAMAGTLVQANAESLATLILVNLVSPGHPMIFGTWPFVSDLRTGAFSGGGGEEAILSAAAAQVSNFYNLPSGVAAGMSDSKIPDVQAGFEKGISTVLAGLSGANMVQESAGMLGSLLGASYESFVIDNESLGLALRTVRGIEVTDETLSYEVIAQAVDGPGHFLGSDQTIDLMQKEYLYPKLSDRSTPDEWALNGKPTMRENAKQRVREILNNHFPATINAATDQKIRERFKIDLPVERVRPDEMPV
ncbi:MAG: trimethylamine methyltransferase family protein [Pseudomonadota bacterium]